MAIEYVIDPIFYRTNLNKNYQNDASWLYLNFNTPQLTRNGIIQLSRAIPFSNIKNFTIKVYMSSEENHRKYFLSLVLSVHDALMWKLTGNQEKFDMVQVEQPYGYGHLRKFFFTENDEVIKFEFKECENISYVKGLNFSLKLKHDKILGLV